MDLVEVKVDIPFVAAAAVDTALVEAGLQKWSVFEDVIVKHSWVIGIMVDEIEARETWPTIESLLLSVGVPAGIVPAMRPLADADWRDSYKAHFHAWQFGRLHWVPVWERATFVLPPGDAVLWLDPGLAFGTGNHETTRLCVERLVTLAEESELSNLKPNTLNPKLTPPRREARVVDAGCGSGILALSAALLGFEKVIGFDNDPEAVRVSEENATLNGMAGRVRFLAADLVTGLTGVEADIIMANIQADVLMRFAQVLVVAVAPGGTLVLSGILAGENPDVRRAFEVITPGWTVNARVMGEWSDIVLVRPK